MEVTLVVALFGRLVGSRCQDIEDASRSLNLLTLSIKCLDLERDTKYTRTAPYFSSRPFTLYIKHEPPEHDLLDLLWLSSSPFINHFSDCVSDSNPSPLNFLFRKPRGDADLQCRLKLPSDVLACCVDCSRHTLEPRYQNTIGQCLQS